MELKMSLLIAGVLDRVAFKASFQPKPFYEPMKSGVRGVLSRAVSG